MVSTDGSDDDEALDHLSSDYDVDVDIDDDDDVDDLYVSHDEEDEERGGATTHPEVDILTYISLAIPLA